jgi:hypothetical protein
VFHNNSPPSQFAVAPFGFRRKLLPAPFLVWRLAVGVQLVQTLIATVAQAFDVGVRLDSALFVQSEVVLRATAVRRATDLFVSTINHDLTLERNEVKLRKSAYL